MTDHSADYFLTDYYLIDYFLTDYFMTDYFFMIDYFLTDYFLTDYFLIELSRLNTKNGTNFTCTSGVGCMGTLLLRKTPQHKGDGES
jgi:hypothetical protein